MNQILRAERIESYKTQFGHSKPLLITAENGKKFLIKRRFLEAKTRTGTKIIDEDAASLQEYISYRLANLLEVPVPKFAIIKLDHNFCQNNYEQLNRDILGEGEYFGSAFLENAKTGPKTEKQLKNPENIEILQKAWQSFLKDYDPKVLAEIIVFSLFVANADCFDNLTNILFTKNKVYAIDFAHSFGGPELPCKEISSTVSKITKENFLNLFLNKQDYFIERIEKIDLWGEKPNSLGKMFDILVNMPSFKKNPFTEIVSKIEALDDEKILEIFDEIPDSWFKSRVIKKQKLIYIDFLKKNRLNVKAILEKMETSKLIRNDSINKCNYT
ncbi:MAG: hypothetical protein M3036_15610 [Bifidobacteriales bacterium]|nr:hypothetical protein [Bifidobacteriales bacterium]